MRSLVCENRRAFLLYKNISKKECAKIFRHKCLEFGYIV